MPDRWHFEKGEYWNYSGDVENWRRRLKNPLPPAPVAELSDVLKGGQVPLIGIPVQPNILWPKERQEEFTRWMGRGPTVDGRPMPIRIPPEYLAEVDLRVSANGTELWWHCGLLAWGFVHFARDELIRAYMAYLERPPVTSVSEPQPALAADTSTMKPLLPKKELSEKTVKEFLQPRPRASAVKDHKDVNDAFPDYNVPRDRVVVPARKDLGRHGPPGRPKEKGPGLKSR